MESTTSRLVSASEAGRGKMAAMERLLSSNTLNEPTEEEISLEQAAVKTVHKEMTEADEANLLDEEDMHVFDREPLSDHLPLVSCNSCKKPVKASQYALHAERCRSLNTSEDTVVDFNGVPVSKKAPRKQRKKISVVQDSLSRLGEGDKLQTTEGDDGVLSESACVSGSTGDDQATPVTSSSNPRGSKRVMNISEGNAPSVGRLRKNTAPTAKVSSGGGMLGTEEIAGTSGTTTMSEGTAAHANLTKMNMIHSSLSPEELDVMCGVMSINGSCCRQPLTCKTHPETSKRAVFGRRKPFDVLVQESKEGGVSRLRSEVKRKRLHEPESNLGFRKSMSNSVCPKPLASKVYCSGHNDRMRFVLGHLYRRNCSSVTPTVVDTGAAQTAVQPPLPAPTFDYAAIDVKPSGSTFHTAGKMQDIRHTMTKPLQAWPSVDQSQVKVDFHSSIGGVQSPHQDSIYLPTSRPTETGLSSLGMAWQNRANQMQTVLSGSSGPQSSFGGGVFVTCVGGSAASLPFHIIGSLSDACTRKDDVTFVSLVRAAAKGLFSREVW